MPFRNCWQCLPIVRQEDPEVERIFLTHSCQFQAPHLSTGRPDPGGRKGKEPLRQDVRVYAKLPGSRGRRSAREARGLFAGVRGACAPARRDARVAQGVYGGRRRRDGVIIHWRVQRRKAVDRVDGAGLERN